jgi:hypothetical protein
MSWGNSFLLEVPDLGLMIKAIFFFIKKQKFSAKLLNFYHICGMFFIAQIIGKFYKFIVFNLKV